MAGENDRAKLRLARFLAAGPASRQQAAKAGVLLLEGGERGTVSVSIEAYDAMQRDGLLDQSGERISLSATGLAWFRRKLAFFDPMREQHTEIGVTSIGTPAGAQDVMINLAESPLGLLARRKTPNGQAFLAAPEIRAGERLRADYTRAQIMPRLGANWQAVVSSGRRAGGAADLTDSALAARQRVDKAIGAVGPELAGVLVDVCCFLKGLETVESERGWPARSAKIVLKAALGALGRHYDPPRRERASALLHWGTQDYRPTV